MKKPKDLRIFELLTYATTRIQCELRDGGTSTGTGFFMLLNDRSRPEEPERALLVTNKHVVKDAIKASLTLAQIKEGVIQATEHVNIPFNNFENHWIPHPDENVDPSTRSRISRVRRDSEAFCKSNLCTPAHALPEPPPNPHNGAACPA